MSGSLKKRLIGRGKNSFWKVPIYLLPVSFVACLTWKSPAGGIILLLMLVSLLALSTLAEYSGFFPQWRALGPTGADGSPWASSLADLKACQQFFNTYLFLLCPQQIPPKLYYFVSFMLTDSPKLLWRIQENSVPHFPLTCRRQGIKQLVLTQLLYSYSINATCSGATPFRSFKVWRQWIPISFEINTDTWGI